MSEQIINPTMSEQIIDPAVILNGYNKYVAIIKRQAEYNKKHKSSDEAKKKQYLVHKAFVLKMKDDVEYHKQLNIKQKARYHIRKAKKMALEEKGKSLVDSLAISENPEIVDNSQKIDLV